MSFLQPTQEILKRMWNIDEKMQTNMEGITEEEILFWNTNLELVQHYYYRNREYWKEKQTI